MPGLRRLALTGFVGICLLHETRGFYGPRVAKPHSKAPSLSPSAKSHAPPSSTSTTLVASTAAVAEPPPPQYRQQAPMTSDDAVVVVLRSCQQQPQSSSKERGDEGSHHHAASDAPQRMDPGGLTPLNLAAVVHQTVTQLRGDGPPMNPLQRQDLEVRLQRLLGRVEVALPEFNHDPLVTVINGLAKLPPRTLRDVLPLEINPNCHVINGQSDGGLEAKQQGEGGGGGGERQSLRPSAMLLPALLKRATKVALQSTPRSLAVLINSLARLESHLEPRRLVLPQGLLPNVALRAREHFPPPPQSGDESDTEDSSLKPETTPTTTVTTNQRFTCQGLSNLINGFARLRFHPGKKFMAGFCAETLRILDEMEPQTLSNVINGLSKLGYRPDTDFLERFSARARVVLHEFTPQGLSNIVNGFARLSPPYYPGGEFLDTLRDLSASCLSNFESRGLAALAHGFSTLGYHPGGAYLDALALAMARRLEAAAEAPPGSSMHTTRDMITGWSLSTVYNGLARLDWKPDGGVVADANSDLSYVPLASETRGDKRPGARLWAATLRWLHTQAPSVRDRPSHDVALGHVIPPASVTMVAANQLLEPQQLTQLLWSLAVMGPPPAAMGLFSRLLATAVQHLDKASACPHAQRQLRQVALFVEAVLGWDGAMAAVGGAAMVSDDHLQRPPSSLFHKEVLRVVEQALGAVCVRNEVDDGVYVKDMVLYPRPPSTPSSTAAAASPSPSTPTSTSLAAATDNNNNNNHPHPPSLPVVIEVDGPPHFYINHPRRCGGDHRLKSRLLSALAGRTNGGVISIAWWEWVGQPRVERVRLILRKLMRVGVDPRAYLDRVDEWAPAVGAAAAGGPVAPPAMAPPTVSAALMSASEWAMGIGDAPHTVRHGKAQSSPHSSTVTAATTPSSAPLAAAAKQSETSAQSTAPPTPPIPTRHHHLDTAPFAFSVVREEGHILSPRQSPSPQRHQKTPSISLHTHHGWASATFTVSSTDPSSSSSASVTHAQRQVASSPSASAFARVQEQKQPLKHMTVTELRDLLRAMGMPVSGRKSELIQRLESVGPRGGRGGKWRRAGSSRAA